MILTNERREELRSVVRERVFLPSSPIKEREQLRGRQAQFERTLDTLAIPGRTAFIFGERGVGKSSLAWTAAYAYNGSDADPIRVACHPSISFSRLIGQIAKRMHDQLTNAGVFGFGGGVKKTTELGLKLSAMTLLQRFESADQGPPPAVDANDAIDLLEALMPKGSDVKRVIIVDELDAVNDPVFRSEVAYFIKQLGDAQSKLKFVFAGIAENVSELLAHHESAQRCMATIKLDRLPLNVLRDIVVDGFRQLDIVVRDNVALRIAALSDGFAHFTHLIGLKMALAVLDEPSVPELVDEVRLEAAVLEAIADSEAVVKDAYDEAVKKYVSYEAVLWSVADHWELHRSTREIHKSLERISDELNRKNEHVEVIDRKRLSVMLNKLKEKAHGEALVSVRRSWFKIRVSMLRGYCRMVAASKGIKVGLDYLQSTGVLFQGVVDNTTKVLQLLPAGGNDDDDEDEVDVDAGHKA